jgi:Mrp family chromosome partitioning ATPase
MKGERDRVVTSLASELNGWLTADDRQNTIRVISGGPGSGKSSFARIFAAGVSKTGTPRVLFVPLHLIDPAKDLVDEIARFVRDEGVLAHNPISPWRNPLFLGTAR